MSTNITDMINTLTTNYITIPKYDWIDIASGEISTGDKIIVAISSNSDKIVVSRDNGITWESSSLTVVNSWRKIEWSPTMKRFCVIAYDSDVYMLSNPITTLTGDLATILTWNKRSFADFSDNTLESISKPSSSWNDLIWISGTITSVGENYNTFIVTSKDFSHAYAAVIAEVDSVLDITGWKPHALIAGNSDLTTYNWKDLCCTNIPTADKTSSSPQFIAIGLNGNLNAGKIAVSNVEYAGNAWTTYDISNGSWIKAHYHPAYTLTESEISSGALAGKFAYMLADNGDIAYTTNDVFSSLTYINSNTQPTKYLSSITSDKIVLSNNTVSNYILNTDTAVNIIYKTVADDTARFALTISDTPIGSIVKVTATDLMYKVVNSNNGGTLDTEACYKLFYQISTTEVSSVMSNIVSANLISANEIKTNLYNISQLTSSDVTKTVTDILKDIRHVTRLDVPQTLTVVNVADDTARFALTTNTVSIGTIVKVLSTEMLYKVINISSLNNANGYTSYGIPYYNIPKSLVRDHLPSLTIEQLTLILDYLQSTNNYSNLSDEQETTYITQIKDTTGAENTGIGEVPINIIDGIIDYLCNFYINPSYDGNIDTRKYLYGIEDSSKFDATYADVYIFSTLYNDVLTDIHYGNYSSNNCYIIDYLIEYINNNQSSCISTALLNSITNALKTDLITYLTTDSFENTSINLEIADKLVFEIAKSIINDSANLAILNKIKSVEALDILDNISNLKWNDIIFIPSNKKFIALSNLGVIAISYDLLNWSYYIFDKYNNFSKIVYVESYNKYIGVVNSNKILISDDLLLWNEYEINTASKLNNVIWIDNINRLCFTDNDLSQLMYLGNFYLADDNTYMLNIKQFQYNNNYKIKYINTNSISNNVIALTDNSKILISNINITDDSTNCSWENANLSKEDVYLLAVDYYSGNYCAMTLNGNILTSTALEEYKWETRKIHMGLDSLLKYGNKITKDPDSGVVTSTIPIAIVMQKYGHFKMSTDFIKLVCKDLNTYLDWKSVCWSEELQLFCAVSSNGYSATIDTIGNVTYGKISDLSAEITSVEYLADLNIFAAVSKCNEYAVSEDGINWYKTYFNNDFKYTKIYHDILLSKTFILAKNCNKLITVEKIIEQVYNEYWTPPSGWPDIKTILTNDTTEGYSGKFIYLIPDYATTISLTGGAAYRTSDGAFYTADTTHTWNTANDIACDRGYYTRWVTVYLNTDTLSTSYSVDTMCLWLVMDCNVSNNCLVLQDDSGFTCRCYILESVEFINNKTFSISDTDFSTLLCELENLQKISDLVLTGVCDNTFGNCFMLKCIGTNLDTSQVTSCSEMFSSCYALERIDSILDFNNVTSDMYSIFYLCYNLNHVYIKNLGISITLDTCDLLSHDSILYMFNNAKTVTDQTITLSTILLAKLTEDDKAIVTNKGWTIATA